MDVSMIDAAASALVIMLDPYRLMILSIGVVIGLVVGILPGIGGLSGIALLLPFTYTMDPYTAFAFLLGLGSVTSTGDPIPAIMFGVPGSAGSQATVLDGFPMAKRGEAGRALSAAYLSSLLGGLMGALLMGLAIPILRPLVLYIGSPELLALSFFGITMVASLSGSTPLRGLAAAGLGIMFAMIGSDPQTSTNRWVFDTLYLTDGLPLLPVALGLFALPELCDLAIARTSITTEKKYDAKAGMWQGAKDVFENWWLVVRCGWIGASLGTIPGIGGTIIDWIAYSHAARTEKGAQATFGKGDVRGVIASEASNNAKEGGSLIPTLAFGVPGSASMSILLGAFLMHGLVPGPEMLKSQLSLTYSMIWTIAIANILGAGLCYLFSGQFAKIATLRYTLILPIILSIIYIGAFEGSRSWGDLYTLLGFGILGWTMKQLKWPRPPLILGFVLGAIIERYMFISVVRYGTDWFFRPAVMVIIVISLVGFARPLLQNVRRNGSLKKVVGAYGKPILRLTDLFPIFLMVVTVLMLAEALPWAFAAKIVPFVVGSFILAASLATLLHGAFGPSRRVADPLAETEENGAIHLDLESDTGHVEQRLILIRAAVFFGWMVAFMASMATIGLIPTVPIFVIAYMRLEGAEPWRLVLPQAIGLTLFIYVMFDLLLRIPWPATLLGSLFPALRVIPSV